MKKQDMLRLLQIKQSTLHNWQARAGFPRGNGDGVYDPVAVAEWLLARILKKQEEISHLRSIKRCIERV